MKKYISRKRYFALLFLVAFFTLVTSFFTMGCERGGDITVVNRHGQEVKIYYYHVYPEGTLGEAAYQGIIPAKSTKLLSILLIYDTNVKRIEAIDPSGETVFSHDYNRADLEEIGWEIVIPP